MTSREITNARMIFKVLVVGNDLPLQTGFLNRVSGDCFSYQLYNTLGVSLGVSRLHYPENLEVILQLWSLPSTERIRGITRSYVKGHGAIIVVVRPEEVESIPLLLQGLSLTSETLFMVVVVGSVIETENEINKLGSYFETQTVVHAIQNVKDAVRRVANHLVKLKEKNQVLPLICSIPESECPPFELQPPPSATEMSDYLLMGLNRSESRKSLLEVAEERLNEGRLSEAGYSMLKKKLHNLKHHGI